MARNEWHVRSGGTLMDFLVQYSGQNKKAIRDSIGAGLVCVNGHSVRRPHHLLETGDVVTYAKKTETPSTLPFQILYEDEDLIAVNKPSGLLSVSGGLEKEKTAYHLCREYLRQTNPQAMIFVVHRLDKDTSGVLLLAKNKKIKLQLQKDWNERVQERGYIALAEGKIKQKEGTLKHYLSESKTQVVYISDAKSGKLAVTHYRVLKYIGNDTLLEIFLDTGRKNQIRVQLAAIGHPLVGDTKYNLNCHAKKRLCLHAHRLTLTDPRTKKSLTIEAPIPDFSRMR